MVDKRAPLDERAFSRRSTPTRRRGTGRQAGTGQPEPRHGRRPKRDAHLVYLVLVRVVARRAEPLRSDPPIEHLHGNRAAIRGRQRERPIARPFRSEEHTSELQSRSDLVCRLLLEKKKKKKKKTIKKKKKKKKNNK